MDGATAGLIGGIVGSVIGVAGGLFGTYMSIRNTKTTAERQFMVRQAVTMWLVLIAVGGVVALAAAGVTPEWTRWAALMVFFIALGPWIRWINHQQAKFRNDANPPETTP